MPPFSYLHLQEQLTSRLQDEENEEEGAGEGRSLYGLAPSCQPSKGPVGIATQRQQVEDSSRSVNQLQNCISSVRSCLPF